MRRITPVLLIASFLVGCQESEPTRPLEPGPVSADIWDGAHGDALNPGNEEFFFLPPLVSSPSRHPDFGDSPFYPDLEPFVRVCELNGDNPPECTGDPIVDNLPMEVLPLDEKYKVNWMTGEYNLDNDKDYRIQVLVPNLPDDPVLLGFRDMDPQRRVARGLTCRDQDSCRFENGSTIPIQVRIERFANCNEATDCQKLTFNLGDGASFEIESSEGNRILFDIPPQDEQDDEVTMGFGLCTSDDSARAVNSIDLPTFGPCASTEILSNWDGVLEEGRTATVSFCELDDRDFGLGTAQGANLRVHAFHEDGTIESLREKDLCYPLLGSLPTNPLLRFASQVRERISSWVGVRPLIASAVLGPGAVGGNSLNTIRTEYIIALGAKIDFYETANPRTAEPGSTLSSAAIVTDLDGNPVAGATVRWNVVPEPTAEVEGSITPVSAGCYTGTTDDVVCTTGSTGVVEVDWTLDTDLGENQLTAGGIGIADPRDDESCSVSGQPHRCNGPRDETYPARDENYEDGSFDPFTPIAYEESGGDDIVVEGDEGADTIPDGTRLLFTAFGSSLLTPDQVNDPPTLVSYWCGSPDYSLYQGFTPSLSPLAAVEQRMWVGPNFPATGGLNTTIHIRLGSPTGTVLGSATAFVPSPQTSATRLLVRYDFSPAIALTPGSLYVIEWPDLESGPLSWLGVVGEELSGGPYDGGTAFGCTGSPNADQDFNFITYTLGGE